VTWLQRWVHRLVAWCTPPEAPLSEPLRTVLDDISERLHRIESLASLKVETQAPVSIQLPAKRIADCGHETTSWFADVAHGYTRCPACNQKTTR